MSVVSPENIQMEKEPSLLLLSNIRQELNRQKREDGNLPFDEKSKQGNWSLNFSMGEQSFLVCLLPDMQEETVSNFSQSSLKTKITSKLLSVRSWKIGQDPINEEDGDYFEVRIPDVDNEKLGLLSKSVQSFIDFVEGNIQEILSEAA
jgi:hypothetical protein